MRHNNLLCYENYEIFSDEKTEKEYKDLKLLSSNTHVDFIKKLYKNKKINFLELGSGNSKTLFNLSKNNVLNYGYGFEISTSRYKFAEKWKNELGDSIVQNINDNFINLKKYNITDVDLVFCVDLALQFCDAIELSMAKNVLKDVYEILKPSGKLILELDGLGEILKSTEVGGKLWEEFEEGDPWQFSLWDCSFDETNKILEWNKIFIHRYEKKIDTKKVELKIYTKETISSLLEEVGFTDIVFYNDWDFSDFEDDFGNFIIVCNK